VVRVVAEAEPALLVARFMRVADCFWAVVALRVQAVVAEEIWVWEGRLAGNLLVIFCWTGFDFLIEAWQEF
jgi:hypothetical protein